MKTHAIRHSSAAVLALSTALHGQSTPPTGASTPAAPAPTPAATQPSAGLVNDWLRDQSAGFSSWDIGGQQRLRYEYREHFAVPGAGPNAVDFRADTPEPDNSFLLSRTKFHVGYDSPCGWFSLFGEGRNSSSTGDARNPNPASDGAVDLHQAYLELGNPDRVPFTLKVGRQELSYGDERLIGAFDWDNIGRVFDAGKLRFQSQDVWIDAFAGRVVIPDDNNWNDPNWYDWFWGLYASTRAIIPKQDTQLFFLADNASADSAGVAGTGVRGNTPRDIYTLGTRFKSLPGQFKGWDYAGEAAVQFGDFAYAAGTPGVVSGTRLDHTAFAGFVAGGYTFADAWGKPRVGLEYNFATGDTDPGDDHHGTFVNLYPTNHKFYGYMDFLAWQNLHNPRLTFSFAPVKNLTVRLDYHLFWLATTEDFLYQVNQAPRTTGGYGLRPGQDGFVGQEIDLVASYAFKNLGALEAGFGHFFTGSYVDDTLAGVGGAADANWVYLQGRLSF